MVIKEPKAEVVIRPQLHVILLAEIGAVKSTMLAEVGKRYKIMPYTNITKAALVGTIDRKTLQIIPAGAWDVKNKPFLIDEFKITDKGDTLDALLQLTENQYYKRKIGTFSSDLHLKSGDLFFKVNKGTIEVKTRFNCIIASMKWLEYSRMQDIQALLSRCVPYRFEPSMELLKKVAEGEKLYEYEKFVPKTNNDTIITSDYLQIKDFVDNKNVDKQIYLRAIGDCVRAFATLNEHDEKIYNLICECKQRAIECYNIVKASEKLKYIKKELKEKEVD